MSSPVVPSSWPTPSPTPAAHAAPPASTSQSGSPRSGILVAPAVSTLTGSSRPSGAVVVAAATVVAAAVVTAGVLDASSDPPQAVNEQAATRIGKRTGCDAHARTSGRTFLAASLIRASVRVEPPRSATDGVERLVERRRGTVLAKIAKRITRLPARRLRPTVRSRP